MFPCGEYWYRICLFLSFAVYSFQVIAIRSVCHELFYPTPPVCTWKGPPFVRKDGSYINSANRDCNQGEEPTNEQRAAYAQAHNAAVARQEAKKIANVEEHKADVAKRQADEMNMKDVVAAWIRNKEVEKKHDQKMLAIEEYDDYYVYEKYDQVQNDGMFMHQYLYSLYRRSFL